MKSRERIEEKRKYFEMASDDTQIPLEIRRCYYQISKQLEWVLSDEN